MHDNEMILMVVFYAPIDAISCRKVSKHRVLKMVEMSREYVSIPHSQYVPTTGVLMADDAFGLKISMAFGSFVHHRKVRYGVN